MKHIKLEGVEIDLIDFKRDRYCVRFMHSTKWGYSSLNGRTEYTLNKRQVEKLCARLESLGYIAHPPIPPRNANSWVFDTKLIYNDHPLIKKIKGN